MRTCKNCLHVAVCGKYVATGGYVRNCVHYLEREWIPVSEQMPTEENGTVLVCLEDKFPYNEQEPIMGAKHDSRVTEAYYSTCSERWIRSGVTLHDVTHWMPKPKPVQALPEQIAAFILHNRECPMNYKCLATDCMECLKQYQEIGAVRNAKENN